MEWEFQVQKQLDSFYQLSQNGNFENYLVKRFQHTGSYDFYAKSEIFQLGFGAASKANPNQVEGIDYSMAMPFETVMNSIKHAGHTLDMAENNEFLSTMERNASAKCKTMI